MDYLAIGFTLLAYITGSLSTAIIMSKIMGFPDPRSDGSRNPGATNVLRLGGKKAAAFTLLGDVLKGFIPVYIAKLIGIDHFALALIALAAVFGHLYPLFFNFKGGKGIATLLGVLLGLSWWLGLFAMLTWLIIAKLFKYSSLASITTAISTPIFAYFLNQPSWILPLGILAAVLILKHHENISRLLKGEEDKIGTKG